MWNEPSAGVASKSNDRNISQGLPAPAIVESVQADSIGESLGFEPGDKILSINGIRPRDLIDYRLLISNEELYLRIIDSAGRRHELQIEKEEDDELGLSFTEALFDGLIQCNNNCPFCFIDQQPTGKRKSLYLKDDDYRMSFLYGSYLTLTNLTESDWKRIEEQRLSPLFVSVHATEPKLRSKLLKNPRAGLLMEQINWFAKRNLQIHAQIVVCPGINDGNALTQTLTDLAENGKGEWPVVLSTAVVPVGLTRFRPINDGLVPVTSDSALKVISQVETLQKHFKTTLGSNFAWLSDEWYLIAGKALPTRSSYENFPQQENGVGSIRAFLKEIDVATSKLPKRLASKRSCSWVVGRLVEESLQEASDRINQIHGLTLHLYGLSSPYWGQEQVVTGLITGQDLLTGLQGLDLGQQLLLPSVMLREGENIFLDDMRVEEVATSLNVPIKIVSGADDIVAAALGDGGKIL